MDLGHMRCLLCLGSVCTDVNEYGRQLAFTIMWTHRRCLKLKQCLKGASYRNAIGRTLQRLYYPGGHPDRGQSAPRGLYTLLTCSEPIYESPEHNDTFIFLWNRSNNSWVFMYRILAGCQGVVPDLINQSRHARMSRNMIRPESQA